MNLRRVFNCLLVAVLLGGAAAAQAQTKLPPRRAGSVAPRPRMVATGAGLKDGLMMQKGRVVLTELGVTNPLTADKTLINGVRISPTGLVTAKDSSTVQLGEGDVVSLTGRVTSRTSIADADSLLKIKTFDLRYPGKRKKMEEERERKEKAKAKLAEEKEKAKAKRSK